MRVSVWGDWNLGALLVRMEKWYSHRGKQFSSSSEIEAQSYPVIQQFHFSLFTYRDRKQDSNTHLDTNVPSSTTPNRHKVGTTPLTISR